MISIFAKRAFLNTNPYNDFISKEKSYKGHGHLQRVSSMIRADQIATEIGATLNPTDGYKDDVCIYVKPHIKKGEDFTFEGRKAYLDIIDGHNLGQLLLKYPEVGLIVCSKADYDTMSQVVPHKIVLIPQHHCNFERLKRTRTEVKRIGVVGTQSAFSFLPIGLTQELEARGMELVLFSKFFDRKDIVDFYTRIDLQIVWRPYKKLLSNPLKIVNAASFGIPTIALEEKAFEEMGSAYMSVKTFDELISFVDAMRNKPDFYKMYADECLLSAEKYHISNIGKLYLNL